MTFYSSLSPTNGRAEDVLLDVDMLLYYNKIADTQGVAKVLLIWKHVTCVEHVLHWSTE